MNDLKSNTSQVHAAQPVINGSGHGDMPLEELLAMYGYGERDGEGGAGTEVECSVGGGSSAASSSSSEEGAASSGLRQLYAPNLQPQCGAVGIGSGGASAAGGPAADDDGDYNPQEDEDWRKTIMVGSDYQAGIPEGLCKYDDALPYENEDKLLWEPSALKESEVEDFLVRAQEPSLGAGVSAIPTGAHTRDDERALYLLLQCGYNVEEALRRRRMNALPPADTMSLWSEEECRNFENGLRTYGKDFHLIQQNKRIFKLETNTRSEEGQCEEGSASFISVEFTVRRKEI